MNKLKLALAFFAMVISGVVKSQTLEEGKKFFYYERYKSAKSVFEKLVAANPNNVEAVYWLGEALIAPEENKDINAAKELYQKTLMNNSNSALLLAGMGHVELLEGKTQDARSRFETALSLSQNKDAAVLNAVGFANINAEKGDAQYAVDKLKLATTLKKMKDPGVWANLGDAYKKLLQGGPAQSAYEEALLLDPNYARASYSIGKIYQTQGVNQKDIYMRYFNDAIAKDAAYAPVYETLYELLYSTDVTQSGQYLDKYLANTDDDPKNCYYRTSMKYAQGLFSETISMADECLKAPAPYEKLYGLKAYAYAKLGDSVNAKQNFENYFAKAAPSVIGAGDYVAYAGTLLKFPGSDSLAGTYVDKAIALDTLENNRTVYIKTMAAYYEKLKDFKKAGDWYNKLLSVKKNVNNVDLYNAGYSYFRAGEYPSSINVFTAYTEKYPNDAFGYYMIGKANWAIDSTLAQGLANASFEKAIEAGLNDSVKYKAQLIGSYKYFVVYSVYKGDKAAAIDYCDKILALDPADAETLQNKEILSKAPAAKPKAPARGTTPKK